jgi:hypothetical protein
MSSYDVTYSAELMQNYFQATIMAPEKEFRAVQKSDGGALLFSIGTGGSFNVTAESPGSRHGWKTVSLNEDQGLPCQHFAVAERADGSIHMAMVLREMKAGQTNDVLYLGFLSLSSSGDINSPTWAAFPFDDPKASRSRLEIAGILLSGATDGEYIVADVVRDPSSAIKEIERYYIDPKKDKGCAWHEHDLPIDIDSQNYVSVLGRKDGESVDGIYTSGHIAQSPQIIYKPLFNVSRPDREPAAINLKLTLQGKVVPDAIAVCRNPDNTSDLYATAKGVLYRFASTLEENDDNDVIATVATSNALFEGVKDLYAFAYSDGVVVWGRNANNETFYTKCPRSQLDKPAAWSFPVPILTGVDQVAPFVNRENSASTIFAHTGASELKMGVKSPGTGIWSWRSVTLPPPPAAPAQPFNSFTTRIQVTDAEHQPASGVTVAVSATNVTSVYINHLYCIVGPAAIQLKTDAVGSLTIVEAVPRMTGTKFKVCVVEDAASEKLINPMENVFKKATDLQSVESLKAASITSYVKGPDGTCKRTTRPLIRPGVDDKSLNQAAHLNKQLVEVSADLTKEPTTKAYLESTRALSVYEFPVPEDAPEVDAGDLFQFLEAKSAAVKLLASDGQAGVSTNAQESFWQMLVRWFKGAWEFVVKIGEAVYRCVMKAIEDVVSAVRWVFEKIVAFIEDLVEFLQYLFDWDDIKRTKEVFKNMTHLFLKHQIKLIPDMKAAFDSAVDSAVDAINKWAGIHDFAGLGEAGSGRMNSQGKADGPDAAGSLLIHHFQGNIAGASQDKPPSVPEPPSSKLFEALENAMAQEKTRLDQAFEQLQQLAQDAHSMSVVDILKRLIGILADAVLRSAQVVIDALFDVIHAVAELALELLEAPIHIPVVSDILNAIGIPDVSVLDVVCWIGAVPVTIGYKLAEKLAGKEPSAPFPDNEETRFLIETNDFQALAAAFKVAPHLLAPGGTHSSRKTDIVRAAATAGAPVQMSKAAELGVSAGLHSFSGVCGWVSAYVDAAESLIPAAAVKLERTIGCVACAIAGGAARAAANFFVPREPFERLPATIYNGITTGLFIGNKVLWAVLEKYDSWPLPSIDYRARSAIFDAVLVLPAGAMTCWHFHELAQKPAGKARTMAILDETSFMATYVARLLYTAVVNDLIKDPKAKLGVAATMGGAQMVHAILQFSEAAVEGLEK